MTKNLHFQNCNQKEYFEILSMITAKRLHSVYKTLHELVTLMVNKTTKPMFKKRTVKRTSGSGPLALTLASLSLLNGKTSIEINLNFQTFGSPLTVFSF